MLRFVWRDRLGLDNISLGAYRPHQLFSDPYVSVAVFSLSQKSLFHLAEDVNGWGLELPWSLGICHSLLGGISAKCCAVQQGHAWEQINAAQRH